MNCFTGKENFEKLSFNSDEIKYHSSYDKSIYFI